jgi:DNA-binding transcriptional MerR regulator
MQRVTLTQAAKVLGVPQHRLIHLCEKGVVVPDVSDARGRGSSRGFSHRNVFEFAIALELRRLDLPVALARAVVRVLRSFEEAVRTLVPDFALPTSLQEARAPRVTALIVGGERLYFTVSRGRKRPTVFGSVEITRAKRAAGKPPAPLRRLSAGDVRQQVQGARTLTEIDLSRIASTLDPKEPQ